MYAASVPFWYLAVRKVKKALTHRTVPVLALFAAFSFVLMMFNVPLPGGTTGHAVGGTLLAIILGPWEAVLGITIVLGIQALFFGDGGLMTFGANVFNMAIVLPLVGYFIYRVISANSDLKSPRRIAGAIIGSYVAIIVAAALAGLELGIQPTLFHTSNGTPLYAPYGLNIAMPAMLLGHVAIAGPIEAIVTGLVLIFVIRYFPGLIKTEMSQKAGGKIWLLWGVLGLIALATPIGLLASGTAWGEWGIDELSQMGLGFIPQGLNRISGWWPAPLPDYGFPRMGAVIGYVLCAFIGVALVGFLIWLLARWIARKQLNARGSTLDT